MPNLKLADGCRMPVDAFVQALLRRAGVAVQALPLHRPVNLLRSWIEAATPGAQEHEAIVAAVDQQLSRYRHLRRPQGAQLCVFDEVALKTADRPSDDAYVVLDGVGIFDFTEADAPIAGLALELRPGDYVHIAANVRHRICADSGSRLTAVRYSSALAIS